MKKRRKCQEKYINFTFFFFFTPDYIFPLRERSGNLHFSLLILQILLFKFGCLTQSSREKDIEGRHTTVDVGRQPIGMGNFNDSWEVKILK